MEKEKMQVDATKYEKFTAETEAEAKMAALEWINKQAVSHTEPVRPKIPFKQWLCGLIIPTCLYACAISTFCLYRYSIWTFILAMGWVFYATIRPFTVLAILNYQKFAPASIRNACRFTPSCSNYMLMAIEKYGYIHGVIKGIYRIIRCHYPNGGEDYP